MNSFIWKDKDSYLDYGIIINKLPSTVKAERNIEEIEVEGRDGDLTIDYKTYKPITFTLECTLLNFERINEVKAWLDGFEDLIFSWENDKYYKAKLVNKIDIEQSLDICGEFQLLFKAQPFAYSTQNSIVSLIQASTIYNLGSINSKPLIKVFGTGDINLIVNGDIVNLYNVIDFITLDSEIMDAYKDTLLKNNDMNGEFPELVVGENTISWVGAVTKVDINLNQRYL